MKFSQYYLKSSKNGLSKSFKDSDEGVRIVNMKELFGYNPITDSVEMRKVELSNSELERFGLKYDDLLFGRRSLMYEGSGKTTIYKGEFPTVFESSIIRVRLDKQKLHPDFANYYFNSKIGRGNVLSIVTGAAVFGIRGSDLSNLKVDFPNIKRQEKIVSILTVYDDLIENNNQRIQLLEEMAEEIYKEWFVRFRFPGCEDAKFVDKAGKQVPHGTKGSIPEGWTICRVSDFGKIVTGKTPPKDDDSNFDGPIPFIKTPDMGQGMFFTTTEESLSEKGAISQKGQFVQKNSICVSCIGTVGKLAITTTLSQTNQQINSITPKESYYLEFLYFSLLRLKPVIESYAATGATMANLSKGKFERLKLLKPESGYLEEYSKIVSSFFEEIKVLLRKNQILQETRDLLLPRLISGKLSVENLEMETVNVAAEPELKY
ncbi:restriction endonuclease subunit S [Arenibacter lacus]|uniref:restriction endonuclease subunit S n=1 Tax=Arenibacter lacus TaxID=2608629 RepID=UPI00123DC31E|nr:restriction endonuclease subunit S [Arenibacter lacus]